MEMELLAEATGSENCNAEKSPWPPSAPRFGPHPTHESHLHSPTKEL